MNIITLDWDSLFFGLRIGRVDLQTPADAAALLKQYAGLKQQYDLLYVFDAAQTGFSAAGAQLVDKKILYAKSCEPCQAFTEVSLYQGGKPTDALYRLALISGGHSRFKIDTRFPKDSYERLYRRWMENACPATGTNKQVLVFTDPHGQVKGMLTIDYQDSLGHIGLVAVDTDTQHMGIGSKLMSTVEGYLFERGVKTLEVPTQKANTAACRWYGKNGFAVQSEIPVYHWWL